jgi:hypothetical protein
MALLTADYWIRLISRFTTCSAEQGQFVICTSTTPVAWFQIAALIGGSIMIAFDNGRRRALAITVLGMIVFLHFYFLIGMEYTLGPVHILGYNYLYWPLFPFIFAVVVAASAMIVGSVLRKHGSIARWIPAFANTGIAIVGLVIFINVIYVRQPRMAGEGIFGLRPIAHYPVHKGDIHRYLEDHVALSPGKEFRGYVTLYLGADDSVVRKRYPTSNGAMAHATYVHARDVLSTQFGNMFQLTDLWNSNIPTLDDYGQWLTKQMYMFNSDLLAQPGDALDPTGVATHLYKFVPELLAKLGVRYVISDGTLNNPLVTEVAHETSKEGMTVRLYEIRNTNLGNLSPTKVVIADSYDDAVLDLQKSPDAAILLGSTTLPSDLVPADQVRLTVMKGGYHITAESAGTSLLVLPVQFSHCWKLVGEPGSKAGLFRANIVQTGIYFQGKIDADLRFEFGVTNSSCRKRDGGDMRNYSSTSRSKMYQFF